MSSPIYFREIFNFIIFHCKLIVDVFLVVFKFFNTSLSIIMYRLWLLFKRSTRCRLCQFSPLWLWDTFNLLLFWSSWSLWASHNGWLWCGFFKNTWSNSSYLFGISFWNFLIFTKFLLTKFPHLLIIMGNFISKLIVFLA